jgi:hypothetical protein
MGVFFLDLWIIPYFGKVLEPIEKLTGLGDLFCPLIRHVKVVHEKVARLISRPHNKVVLTSFKEPF